MSKIKAPLSTRLKSAKSGIFEVYRSNPLYAVLGFVIGFIMSGFVIWALNFNLLEYVLTEAPISAAEKARLLWDVQTGIYTKYSSPQATGIILFGQFFGVNAALIIYAIRKGLFRKIPKKSGTAGFIVAVLSGGCIACGTSILAPLFATIGATSSAFVADLSNYLNWISILLISYSIYKLGGVINSVQKHNE